MSHGRTIPQDRRPQPLWGPDAKRKAPITARGSALLKIALLISQGNPPMWLLILEALGALALLVLFVWWTMFSGRKRGEREDGGPDAR